MTSRASGGVVRPTVYLTVSIILGWVVCFWPARYFGGESGVFWMSVAAGCCLIPGWIVLILSRLSVFPNELAAMLAQMTVRLTLVGAAAVVVKQLHPEFGPGDFHGWLIGFYLLALFVEVWLLKSAIGSVSAADQAAEDGDSAT